MNLGEKKQKEVKMDLQWYYWLLMIVGGYLTLGFIYASMIASLKYDNIDKGSKQERLARRYWPKRIDLQGFMLGFSVKRCMDAGGVWLIDSMIERRRLKEIRRTSLSGFWRNFLLWPRVLVALIWATFYMAFQHTGVHLVSPPKHWIA